MNHRFAWRVLQTAGALLLFSVTLLGCAEERKVTNDPAAMEKARQEHIQNSQRELQENR